MEGFIPPPLEGSGHLGDMHEISNEYMGDSGKGGFYIFAPQGETGK